MSGSSYLFGNEKPEAGDRFDAQDELDGFLDRLDAGDVDPSSPLLVSAWGQRPLDVEG